LSKRKELILEIKREDLEERYCNLSTEELIEVHQKGGLTDMAFAVLKDELSRRSITADQIDNVVQENVDKRALNFNECKNCGATVRANDKYCRTCGKQLPESSPTYQLSSHSGEPSGLKGWLILPILGLCIFPIRITIYLINDFLPLFQEGSWEILTTPGSEMYHHLWAPLLIFEIGGNLLFIAFAVALLFLLFTKSYRFPTLFILFIVLNLVFVVCDFFLGGLIPAVAAVNDESAVRELVRSFLGLIIWGPYFLYSRRVKNTFVN
jgi:hypothetical protein